VSNPRYLLVTAAEPNVNTSAVIVKSPELKLRRHIQADSLHPLILFDFCSPIFSQDFSAIPITMVQTPQQRRANEKFARTEASKRGKAETVVKKTQQKQPSPISPVWIGKC